MKNYNLILTVSLLMAVSGCSQGQSETDDQAQIDAPYGAFTLNVPDPSGNALSARGAVAEDKEEVEAASDFTVFDVQTGLLPLMEANVSLQDAESSAIDRINKSRDSSDVFRSVVHQIVASVMVQRHLDAAQPDLAAVSRYTQMLLDNESPNAHLLARSLPVLRGTWDEARVSTAAERGVADATVYLAKTCPACNAPTLARSQTETGQTAATGAVDQQRKIQDGIAALESL